MAKIKIFLDPGENEIEVREKLSKALMQAHGEGDRFTDPLMDNIEQKMLREYRKTLNDIIAEISEELHMEK